MNNHQGATSCRRRIYTGREGHSSVERLIVAALFVGVLAVILAQQANAFDRGTCRQHGAWDMIQDVDYIRVNAGKVDFGDSLHLGGEPKGDAVVCWYHDSGLYVIGRLYWDDWGGGCAKLLVDVYESQVGDLQTRWDAKVCSDGGGLREVLFERYLNDPQFRRLKRIRVTLVRDDTVVRRIHKKRGD